MVGGGGKQPELGNETGNTINMAKKKELSKHLKIRFRKIK